MRLILFKECKFSQASDKYESLREEKDGVRRGCLKRNKERHQRHAAKNNM